MVRVVAFTGGKRTKGVILLVPDDFAGTVVCPGAGASGAHVSHLDGLLFTLVGHPSMNLADFVNNLKTVSSRKIRKEFAAELRPYFWKPVFWNSAYAVVSAGGHASMEQLIAYIQNQERPA